MNTCTRLRRLTVAATMILCVAAISVAPRIARAVTSNAVVHNVQYSVTFRQQHSSSAPFTGTMRLNFNNGYITGWYLDNSIRPGSPFGTRQVNVTGGTSNGHIHLTIRNITITGTLEGRAIRASALLGRVRYTFDAQQH